MKKPWQIWLIYALSLLIVIPAMVWLSLQALELERARENDRLQTELARREAELQERISSALWRMDGFLTNLVAKEATRPWYLYQSFYDITPAATQPSSEQQSVELSQSTELSYCQASPLLFQPSEFVRLHFQINSENEVTSPQHPRGKELAQAYASCGLTPEQLDNNRQQLEEVREIVDFKSLLLRCPSRLLPETQTDDRPTPQQVVLPSNEEPVFEGQTDSPRQETQSDGSEFSFIRPSWNHAADPPPQQEIPKGQKFQLQQSNSINRGAEEFTKRQQSADNYAMNEWLANNRFEPQMVGAISTSRLVREGVMQPLWIDDRLILARRVKKEDDELIQCCWLNWTQIQAALREQVSDLLPDVQFEPIRDSQSVQWGQALATLPVQLDIDREQLLNQAGEAISSDRGPFPRSGIRVSLGVAWIGLAFAAIAGAVLLHGVLRLSERRGAFVSAVSHELRTPLTTFRMYAEMLAEKMVPADRQQKYAETLRAESERLSHLVENVLQFARLERSRQKTRTEHISVEDLLQRFQERLHNRADCSEMKLEVKVPDSVRQLTVETDPVAVEQILFNLVDNACKYANRAKDRRIILEGQKSGRTLKMSVRDFGPGVKGSERKRMFRAFRKSDQDAADSAHGVGLGLALCRRMARSLGGRLRLGDSATGTLLVLELPTQSSS